MPSKNNLSMLKLQKTIDNLKEDISKLPHDNVYINKITKKLKPETYGLTDLIANKTPTFADWTVEPTDASNITDGNINTLCTTGSKNSGGGWQYAFFNWDLGGTYNILCTGALSINTTAGDGYSYLWFWDGTDWIMASGYFVNGSSLKHGTTVGGVCSKVRLGITSSAAATITPNIRDLHVWRLK